MRCSFLVLAVVSMLMLPFSGRASLFPNRERSTISAGVRHSLVLQDDGTVWACGSNSDGQLGDDPATLSFSAAPRKITGLANIISVAAGDYHSMALSSTGAVYSWGRNTEGQLGRGGTNYTPTQVSTLIGITSIAAGDRTSFAIRSSDGAVYGFGDNTQSALGLSQTIVYPAPTLLVIPSAAKALKVSSISTRSIALMNDGTVYVWGTGTYITGNPTPVRYLPVTNAVDVAASGYREHNTSDPASDYYSQSFTIVGSDGWLAEFVEVTDTYYPRYPNGLPFIFVTGKRHGDQSYAIRSDGTCGFGGITLAAEIAAGGDYFLRTGPNQGTISTDRGFCLIRDRSGAVYGFGCNDYGQLGDGSATAYHPTPVQVSVLKNMTSVVSGADLAGGIDSSNQAWWWGHESIYYDEPMLLPYTTQVPRTFRLPTGVTAVDMAVADNYIVALGSDKKLYDLFSSIDLSAITTGKKLAISKFSGYCLLTNGTVRSWGDNSKGQLGTGNTTSRATPGAVLSAAGTALTGIVDIAAGPGYALFLGSDGKVRSTGLKSLGMGTGIAGNSLYANAASLVPGLTTAAGIRTGNAWHNLARTTAGSLVIWGDNRFGAFGNGGTTNPNTIFTVPGVTLSATSVFGGGGSISYFLNGGQFRAWGANDAGQLGRSDVSSQLTPPLTGPGNFDFAAANDDATSFGIGSTGKGVYAWGDISRRVSGVWHPYLSQMAVRLDNNPPPPYDTDADGMDDALEMLYFHTLANKGTEDPDGDGLTTIEELNFGLNPTTSDTAGANNGITDLGAAELAYKPEVRMRLPGNIVNENSAGNTILVTSTDTGDSGRTYQRLTDPTHGVVSETSSSGYISYGGFHYTPNPNYHGPDSFTYKAVNTNVGVHESIISTVEIRVNAIPQPTNLQVSTNEETPVGITLGGSDADGEALTYQVLTSPSHGTLSGNLTGNINGNVSVTYTPSPNYSNDLTGTPDTFTFRVTDPTGAVSGAGTVSILVHNVDDDPPTAAASQTFTVVEDTPTTLTLQSADPDSALTFVVTTPLSPHGTLSNINGTSFTFTPGADRTEAVTFSVNVTDGVNPPVPVSVRVNITAVNDLPRPVAGVASISQNAPTTALMFQAIDPDDATLTYTYFSQTPTKGIATLTNANTGAFTFKPNANVTGDTSITFFVSDGHGQTASGTFLIHIFPNNPPAISPATAVLYDQSIGTTIPISATDTDGPQPLTFVNLGGTTYGALSGTFPNLVYTPSLTKIQQAGAAFSGVDTFNVGISDGALSVNGQVTVNYTALRPGFDPAQTGFIGTVMERSDDGFTNDQPFQNHTENFFNLDESHGVVIPFGFQNPVNFFGQNYSGAVINNNGNICFDSALRGFVPGNIVNTNRNMIGVFWADVDTRTFPSQPTSYAQITAEGRPAFAVTWTRCGAYSQNYTVLNTFQLVIIDRTDVSPGDFDGEFNYAQIQWDLGIESHNQSVHIGAGNSQGRGFELYGSGINNYFLDNLSGGGANSTALIRTRNGPAQSAMNGRHIFRFRGGSIDGAPIAQAGPDELNAGSTFVTTATGSSPAGLPVTFSWQEINADGSAYTGPNAATIIGPTLQRPSISLPVSRTYYFRFTVSDGILVSSDDIMVVRP